MMKVTIDPDSGFCFGVKKTIEIAENELKQNSKLICVGEIVHNQEEIKRLEKNGLKTVSPNDLENLNKVDILIRAHGEPPSTYETAERNNLKIIEGTCPIVLKLQDKIGKAYEEMRETGGQVVIFGKSGHPEVIGLLGQTENNAIIINGIGDLNIIDFQKPIRLFAQTTKSKTDYHEIIEEIYEKVKFLNSDKKDFEHYNSICGQVSNRVLKLKNFCQSNEVIIFVSGKNSSNGKYLYSICKEMNLNSYFISSDSDLDETWFENVKTVGISGATSTPQWLMEQVAKKISRY
ncbi:MAG: 4-hydroxy-3-methylbut-2-enyl diphosphate reductase [Bacteroidales bacterium]|nr:4-hydroxy-3-methylbut-2-enyl diphosphate reductase [Bacteroidales bacterium]